MNPKFSFLFGLCLTFNNNLFARIGGGVYYEEAPDLFEMFFGGGMGGMRRRVHYRRRRPTQNATNHRQQQQEQQANPLAQFIQLLPLIVMVLTLVMSSWVESPKPQFSFARQPHLGELGELTKTNRNTLCTLFALFSVLLMIKGHIIFCVHRTRVYEKISNGAWCRFFRQRRVRVLYFHLKICTIALLDASII